jgi:hypothetical protein
LFWVQLEGYSAGEIQLKWVSIRTPTWQTTLDEIGCRHARRITPIDAGAAPTACLIKHLLTKAVSLRAIGSDTGAEPPSARPAVSHVLLEHEGDIYLHALFGYQNRPVPPLPARSVAVDNGGVWRVQCAMMRELVSDSMLHLSGGNCLVGAELSAAGKLLPVSSIDRRTRFITTHRTSSLLLAPLDMQTTEMAQAAAPVLTFMRHPAPNDNLYQDAIKSMHNLFTRTNMLDPRSFNNCTTQQVVGCYARLWAEIEVLVDLCAAAPATHNHIRFATAVRTLCAKVAENVTAGFKRRAADEEGPGIMAAAVRSKAKRNLDLPTDICGNVQLPIHLGASLTVHSLGEVVHDVPSFHNDKYIWPVGYRATRMYTSMLCSDRRTAYLCEVVHGGHQPEFRITPDDQPDAPITASSPSGVWSVVIKK